MSQVLRSVSIGFIGLGEIGSRIAGRLANAGADLTVYNRTSDKATRWSLHHPGRIAVSPSDAVAKVDVLLSCVGTDDDLRSVYFSGSGVLTSLRPGTLVIDHTTASVEVSRDIARSVESAGGAFLDAPVSGGSKGAEDGTLSIMVGGEDSAFDRAMPILSCYSRTVNHLGPTGSGQLCKMVNQICIAGVLQGLAEGLAFAEASGLNAERVLRAISGGAAASWQMVNRSSFMLNRSFPAGFAARWMHKDLQLCVREAGQTKASIPVTALVAQLYSRLLAEGHGEEDFSNIFRLLDTRNGKARLGQPPT